MCAEVTWPGAAPVHLGSDPFREFGSLEETLKAGNLPATLGEFVRERALTLGDRVAGNWFQDERRLTFRDIDEQADRLASGLGGIGVRKGTHVAVMLPNVAETIVTWTALGRLGAVMVPVNANYTPTELSFVLNDSDAQFLIIHDSLAAILEGLPNRPQMLAERNIIIAGEGGGERQSWAELVARGTHPYVSPTPVTGSDLLNIQYTSGTTGFPKGCMLPHEYWIRTGYSLAFTRGENRIGNVLVWAPFFYMDGMWQILSAFFLGATSYVARRMSITHFFEWLQRYRIHSCTFPEPALKAFPAGPADNELELKYIYAFGWRQSSKREAERRFGCFARDAYGMTELGTATVTPISAGEKNFERTCGLPAPQRELKIVDEKGNAVARGEIGELWVRGPGMMWGYYKRPAANADVFRGEWFRTGDYFQQDEDGYYFIVGRMKDSVRRAGENISARELEAVLGEMEEVLESAIVPVPDELRGEEVKAYIRLREGVTQGSCVPSAIIAHCARHLASFKIPRYIAYVEDFPRTPTGKVAKQVLISEAGDLRSGAYDRVDGVWR
jgi:acyl-CoA synthetase (AMP-forming)/AMP-acid ligase II